MSAAIIYLIGVVAYLIIVTAIWFWIERSRR